MKTNDKPSKQTRKFRSIKGLKHFGGKVAILIVLVSGVLALQGFDKKEALVKPETTVAHSPEDALNKALRQILTDHMQYTYSTVDAFFHSPEAVKPTLARLLQNQKDIGAAMVPYYGQKAGDEIAELFTVHIQLAVPVLAAAKSGDKEALDKALKDWYANAKEIADYLSAANPENWPKSATEPMMKNHITQTTTYAVDLLKGDYENAIKHYDEAFQHMMMMADVLAAGIVKQFPEKFKETKMKMKMKH